MPRELDFDFVTTHRTPLSPKGGERSERNDIELAGMKDGATPLRQSTKVRAEELRRLEMGEKAEAAQEKNTWEKRFEKLPAVVKHFIKKRLLLAIASFILLVLIIVRAFTTQKTALEHVHAFIGLAIGTMIGTALMPYASGTPLSRRVFAPLVFLLLLLGSLYPWIPGTGRKGFAQPSSLQACSASTRGYLISKCRPKDYKKIPDWATTPAYLECVDKKDGEYKWAVARYGLYYLGFFYSAIVSMACLIKGHPPSKYVRNAMHCQLTLFLLDMVRFVRQIAIYCGTDRLARDIMINISSALTYLSLLWPAFLIWRRIDALQTSIERQLHAGLLRYNAYFVVLCVVFPYLRRIFDLENRSQSGKLEEFFESLARLALVVSFCYSALVLRKLVKILDLEASRTQDIPRGEALWAAHAIKQEAVVVALYAITIFLGLIGTAARSFLPKDITGGPHNMLWLATLPYVIESMVSSTCVGVMSGVLLKYDDPSIYMTPVEEQKHRATSQSKRKTVEVTKEKQLENLPEWQDKVEKLARRGIRLRDILHFYSRLFDHEIMPTFRPMKSTTNEVVRLAIIPESKDKKGSGGKALATVLNEGVDRLAEKMVSHSWGNTFSHLVAAVVADSLEMTSFDAVQLRLCSKEGVEKLLELLEKEGTIDTVYWICAFCVNQHAGICGGFGPPPNKQDWQALQEWEKKRRDSATNEVFPLCTCTETKYFSNSPVECEMNKFDSMMKYLNTPQNTPAASVCRPVGSKSSVGSGSQFSSFSQVIAVDPDFELFERAWCVAELGIAYEMEIPQNLVINSRGTLEENYHKLSELTIRNCRASHPMDKQMILAKIPHMRTFDQHLQYLIFGNDGLLKSWMDGPGRLANAGLVVSRALRRAAALPSDEFAKMPTAGHVDSPILEDMQKPWFMSAPPPAMQY